MLLNVGHTLRKLQAYKNLSYPILSVYLEIQSSKLLNPSPLSQFRYLTARSLTPAQREELKQDIAYMEAYLTEHRITNGYKGMALFSGGNHLWEVVMTHFSLPTLVSVGHSPYLDPISKELQAYQRYLVVLADREKAKFFTLYLGEVETQAELLDPSVPQKVKGRRNEDRQGKIDRHIQDHLHRHLKLIADKVSVFVQNKYISGVVVGGHRELIHRVEEHLPKRLRGKLVGEFITELNTSVNEIVAKSKSVVNNVHKGFSPTPIETVTI